MLYGYSLQYKQGENYSWFTKTDYTDCQEARDFMFEAKDKLPQPKIAISYVIFKYTSIHDRVTVDRNHF